MLVHLIDCMIEFVEERFREVNRRENTLGFWVAVVNRFISDIRA